MRAQNFSFKTNFKAQLLNSQKTAVKSRFYTFINKRKEQTLFIISSNLNRARFASFAPNFTPSLTKKAIDIYDSVDGVIVRPIIYILKEN